MAAFQAAALLLLLLAVAASEAAEPPQQERTALQTFLAGTRHERSLGWNSPSAPSACLWFGVTCDAANATVVAVRLPGVGLVGRFPAGTLGTLLSLHTLSLRSNHLSGAVPGDIFSLRNLRSLYLQNNRLSGAVPPEIAGLTALRHLALYDNELSGEIPAALDGLAELRSIRLDGNRLTGSIPSLSGLRRLEVFNVSVNQLDGAIPDSLARFPPGSFAGNLGLCGEPLDRPCVVPPVPSEKRRRRRPSGAAIAAIAVGGAAVALLALILLLLCFARRRRRDAAAGGDNVNKTTSTATQPRGLTPSTMSGEMTDLADLTSSKEIIPARSGAERETMARRLVFVGGGAGYSFDLEDLLRASAEVLGKGGAGTTYKAVLEDGTTVVVKRLKDVAAARREFASALEALGRVEHRNLVPVRGYYFSNEEKLLVADYLPAGSLSAALHGSRGSGRTPMDWDARVRAALCAARGMAHLHAAYGLVHGNVKSSNLLLRHGDPDDAAALSDYSLQHLFAPPPAPSARAGGYRAPELVDPRRPTSRSDVYSFGVLFLEILTGKCPASGTAGDLDGGSAALDLPRWVQSVVREEWTAEVFDAELVRLGGGTEEEMVALLQVAMACAATAPDARPEAPEVVKLVEEIGGGRHGRATTEERASEEERSWGTPPAGATP